jgi:hypothetical protein
MTGTTDLERRYRRWLSWYPRSFRREHEAEILAVLMAGAREGQCKPDPVECLDLMRNAIWMRMRPGVPASQRPVLTAVRFMYVGAVVELAAVITIVATIGDVRSILVKTDPALTETEWHAVMARQLVPTAVAAGIAVVFWLWMAWSIGRRHRSARFVFAVFFGLNTVGLFNGLVHGSATYARTDLAVATLLWLVELAAFALIFHVGTGPSRPGRPPQGAGGAGGETVQDHNDSPDGTPCPDIKLDRGTSTTVVRALSRPTGSQTPGDRATPHQPQSAAWKHRHLASPAPVNDLAR